MYTGPHSQGDIFGLFSSLIQCGIGKKETLSHSPSDEEWEALFDIANRQTLQGIAYAGIERLPQEQKPPKHLLLTWHGTSELIKENNFRLNKASKAISEKFTQLGFRNCILKGQGIAQLYPSPHMRVPGDIDIWLEGGADKIRSYVRKCFPDSKPTYHHVDFPIKKGLDIEIHFTPTWAYNPIRNRALQNFMAKCAHEQFCNFTQTPEGTFPTPTLAFNRIYILFHIYRHLFQEGIGLRQLLDYHFVLDKGFTEEEKTECVRMLKAFGLKKFAAATMHVLHKTFGLEPDKFLVAPDPKRGEFLLSEIMTAGNFGQYDSRYAIVPKDNEFKHFINSMHRIARLTMQYPGEVLWSPYFKIQHHFWRKRHKSQRNHRK